jgi:hypothetical protein
MKKALLLVTAILVVYVAYMLISGRSSVYGLVYRESRSIRWHFGGVVGELLFCPYFLRISLPATILR